MSIVARPGQAAQPPLRALRLLATLWLPAAILFGLTTLGFLASTVQNVSGLIDRWSEGGAPIGLYVVSVVLGGLATLVVGRITWRLAVEVPRTLGEWDSALQERVAPWRADFVGEVAAVGPGWLGLAESRPATRSMAYEIRTRKGLHPIGLPNPRIPFAAALSSLRAMKDEDREFVRAIGESAFGQSRGHHHETSLPARPLWQCVEQCCTVACVTLTEFRWQKSLLGRGKCS